MRGAYITGEKGLVPSAPGLEPQPPHNLAQSQRQCHGPSVLAAPTSTVLAARTLARPPALGTRPLPSRLGRYLLFDHVGRGGMADIYLARVETDLGGSRRVIVKEVLPKHVESP